MKTKKKFYGIKLGDTNLGLETSLIEDVTPNLRSSKNFKVKENKKHPYKNKRR